MYFLWYISHQKWHRHHLHCCPGLYSDAIAPGANTATWSQSSLISRTVATTTRFTCRLNPLFTASCSAGLTTGIAQFTRPAELATPMSPASLSTHAATLLSTQSISLAAGSSAVCQPGTHNQGFRRLLQSRRDISACPVGTKSACELSMRHHSCECSSEVCAHFFLSVNKCFNPSRLKSKLLFLPDYLLVKAKCVRHFFF